MVAYRTEALDRLDYTPTPIRFRPDIESPVSIRVSAIDLHRLKETGDENSGFLIPKEGASVELGKSYLSDDLVVRPYATILVPTRHIVHSRTSSGSIEPSDLEDERDEFRYLRDFMSQARAGNMRVPIYQGRSPRDPVRIFEDTLFHIALLGAENMPGTESVELSDKLSEEFTNHEDIISFFQGLPKEYPKPISRF